MARQETVAEVINLTNQQDAFGYSDVNALIDRFEELKTRNEFLEEQQKTLQEKSSANGVTTVNSTQENFRIPVIYGTRRSAGQIIWVYPGEDTGDIYITVAIGEGPIQYGSKMFFNGTQVAEASDFRHNTAVRLTRYSAGQYKDTVRMEFLDGSDSANSAMLSSELGLNINWPNLACVILKLSKTSTRNPYTSGVPNIQFEFAGLIAANPNPASVLLDILTNTRYGYGLSASSFDFTTASNYFAEEVNYYGTRQQRRFTCSRIFDPNNSIQEEITSFLNEYQCFFIQNPTNGKFELIPERAQSPAYNITDDFIFGDVVIAHPDAQTSCAAVTVRFPYEQIDYSFAQQTAVNGTGSNYISVDAKGITNPYEARQLAYQMLRKSNSQKTYSFVLDKAYLSLNVGDVVTIPQGNVRIIEKRKLANLNIEVKAVSHNNDFYAVFKGALDWKLKPRIPIGGGSISVPGSGGGAITQPPGSITTPPGNTRPPAPPERTIAGAATLDDNTDWYLAYSEDGENEANTVDWIDGRQQRLYDSGVPGLYIFQVKLALHSRKYTLNKPARILCIYEHGDTQGLIHFRSGLVTRRYAHRSPETDPNDGYRVTAGTVSFGRTVDNVAGDFPGLCLVNNDGDIAGQYRFDDNAEIANSARGINHWYKNSSDPFVSPPSPDNVTFQGTSAVIGNTIEVYFLGQETVNNGNWYYIGKKSIPYYRGNITDVTAYPERYRNEALTNLTPRAAGGIGLGF